MNNLKRYTLYVMNVTDLVSCVLAFLAAYGIRFGIMTYNPMVTLAGYRDFIFLVAASYVVVNVLSLYNEEDFLTRSFARELLSSVKMTVYLMTTLIIILNFAKVNENYSRVYEVVFALCLVIIDFILRIAVKKYLTGKYRSSASAEKTILIAPLDRVKPIMDKIRDSADWRFAITGLIVTDQDLSGETVEGLKVISSREDMMDDIVTGEADSVFIVRGRETRETVHAWMNGFRELGKIVHLDVPEYDMPGSYHSLDSIGRCAVITYSSASPMPRRRALLRRIINALFSAALFPLFGIVFVIVALLTHLESPGPILVRRVRVGKNGRLFYQYRFRVLRTDVQARRQEGRSPYTVIGKLLEVTHADGMPMLINIFSGDMSFVGPKAPALQEFLKMPSAERAWLCVRPGVVGCWSVTEDAVKVREDSDQYIREWGVFRDLTILFLMVIRYLGFHSTKQFSQAHLEEEIAFLEQSCADQMPLAYDRTVYQPSAAVSYGVYHFCKRLFDIIFSLAAIIVLSPLFLVLTVLVISDDGGVPIYSHQRIGKNGRRITIFKFRSMRRDAGEMQKLLTPEQLQQYRREYKVANDPRITRIGSFLRRSSLDELPQLFNILDGSMSFVGPRPIMEEETRIYGSGICKLLSVQPGLTGYWQTYARNLATYESGERQAMEMYYIDHQSALLDLQILLHTVFSVASEKGAE